MGKTKTQKGFTLIELIISITIFTVFLTAAANGFFTIVRAQTRENEVRKMYTELRDFIDVLNDEVRNNTIDFDCYDSNQPAQCLGANADNLFLISNDGTVSTEIAIKNGQLEIKKLEKITTVGNFGQWILLESNQVVMNQLIVHACDFEIYPDPDATNISALLQPSVHVDLSVKSRDESINFALDYETLITTRSYN